MRGKVLQESIGLGSGGDKKAVWQVRGDDGLTYDCVPSPAQRADMLSLLGARLEVEFETERDVDAGKTYARITDWRGRGDWVDGGVVDPAAAIRAAETTRQEEQAARQQMTATTPPGGSSGESFVNPYNFIRLGDRRSEVRSHSAHGGSGEPDAKYSGTFEVELEALTPLLIPDSDGRRVVFTPNQVAVSETGTPGQRAWFSQYREQGKVHHGGPFTTEEKAELSREDAEAIELELIETRDGLRWSAAESSHASGGETFTAAFRLAGRPAIPLSSIRGMTRSLYEALTNSCMSQFNASGQEGWRPTLNSDREREDYAGAGIQIAPGRIASLPRGRNDGFIELASADFRVPLDELESLGDTEYERRAREAGEKVHFIERDGVVVRISRAPFEGSREGVLKLSGRMPRKVKKHERVLVFDTNPKRIPFTTKDLDQFRDINKSGQMTPRNMKGHLVWVRLNASGKLLSLGRGYIHKVPCTAAGEPSTYGKRLPSASYLPCSDSVGSHEELCPGCGAFGTVMRRAKSAYGGRIAFGTARAAGHVDLISAELRILSQPKPQTGFFYLRRKGGGVADWNDAKSTIAGRKVYLHDTAGSTDAYSRRAHERGHANQATTAELIDQGAKFRYRVRFRDLRDWELGALLIATAPVDVRDASRPMAVKVGGGKPIGLGSATATIVGDSLLIDERGKRYSSLQAHVSAQATEGAAEEYHDAYLRWATGEADPSLARAGIGRVAWLTDAIEVLAWQPLPRTGTPLDVKYPSRVAQGGKERGSDVIYEWFSWARKKGGRQLPTLEQVADGSVELDGWGA